MNRQVAVFNVIWGSAANFDVGDDGGRDGDGNFSVANKEWSVTNKSPHGSVHVESRTYRLYDSSRFVSHGRHSSLRNIQLVD